MMEKQDIAVRIYSKIDELPTLPVVLPHLLKIIEDPASDTGDISRVLSNDPALSSKILKVANSAYYGFSQQVFDMSRAVAILGFKMVRTLAVSISVFESLTTNYENELFTREGLWQHSLATAVIMKELNPLLQNKKNSDYLFTIGLLHDIGKIVLDHFFHEDFKKVIIIANNDNKKLHEVEKEIIGLDHSEIAAILLIRWKFPSMITGPIASLHEQTVPETTDAGDVALLRVANSFAQELDLSKEGNINVNLIRDHDRELLGLTNKKIEQLKKIIQIKREDINALYAALTGTS